MKHTILLWSLFLIGCSLQGQTYFKPASTSGWGNELYFTSSPTSQSWPFRHKIVDDFTNDVLRIMPNDDTSASAQKILQVHGRLQLSNDANYFKHNDARLAVQGKFYNQGMAKFLDNTGQTFLQIEPKSTGDIVFRFDNSDLSFWTPSNQEVAKLNKQGDFFARKIMVTMNMFPDYVFESDYELWSLERLGNYIDSNGKLPGMPSAEQVEKEGMDVGEVNRILVEKIEELTLHIIALNDRVNELESSVKAQ